MHTITNKLRNRVIELKKQNTPEETVRIMIKEILQDYVLAGIYSSDKFKEMVFIGGTALRKLYSLNRFSEDLDFSTKNEIDFEELGKHLIEYFKKLDFREVEYSIQKGELVNRLTLKFRILNEVGLSNFETEKLHVKIETTKGKIYNSELFTKNLSNTPIVISSYPLPTLMAGKILACLNRTYAKGNTGVKIKGRDYYDLIWYMEKGISPSIEVLSDENPSNSISNVFKKLDEKVGKIKTEDLFIDLKTFFEDRKAITIWCENFHKLYETYRKKY